MDKATVATIRCENYQRNNVSEGLKRQFELLGGIESFVKHGDRVLIKPNLIAPKAAELAVQTDGAVIVELARLLKDAGARPFVGDSPAWGNVFGCIEKLGITDELRKMGVDVRQLDGARRCRIGEKGTRIGISSVAMEADAIINLPKFKSHQMLGATFAVKNMFGCVSGKEKAFWHFAKGGDFDNFCEMLIDIYKFLSPVLTIIDGVTAMDSGGPIHGRARKLGWLIAGTDPISCEMVCCRLIDMNENELPIICTAKKIGFGISEMGKIDIAGDDFSSEICGDFVPSERAPLRFSLKRVCKSVLKQAFIAAKSRFAKGKED